jgi:hypothetical protein
MGSEARRGSGSDQARPGRTFRSGRWRIERDDLLVPLPRRLDRGGAAHPKRKTMSPEQPEKTGTRWLALCLPLAAFLLVASCLVDWTTAVAKTSTTTLTPPSVAFATADFALQGNICVRCPRTKTGAVARCVCLEGFSASHPGRGLRGAGSPGPGLPKRRRLRRRSLRFRYCHLRRPGETRMAYCTAPDCPMHRVGLPDGLRLSHARIAPPTGERPSRQVPG